MSGLEKARVGKYPSCFRYAIAASDARHHEESSTEISAPQRFRAEDRASAGSIRNPEERLK